MSSIRVRIFKPADATVGVVLELPEKSGDEGFRFLEEFEKKFFDGKRNEERDARWRSLMLNDAAERKVK